MFYIFPQSNLIVNESLLGILVTKMCILCSSCCKFYPGENIKVDGIKSPSVSSSPLVSLPGTRLKRVHTWGNLSSKLKVESLIKNLLFSLFLREVKWGRNPATIWENWRLPEIYFQHLRESDEFCKFVKGGSFSRQKKYFFRSSREFLKFIQFGLRSSLNDTHLPLVLRGLLLMNPFSLAAPFWPPEVWSAPALWHKLCFLLCASSSSDHLLMKEFE